MRGWVIKAIRGEKEGRSTQLQGVAAASEEFLDSTTKKRDFRKCPAEEDFLFPCVCKQHSRKGRNKSTIRFSSDNGVIVAESVSRVVCCPLLKME